MRKYTIDISCPSQECHLHMHTSVTHRRAVAIFFNGGGGGGTIASAEDTSLVGVSGSSPRKLSNLEAPKSFFQHLS